MLFCRVEFYGEAEVSMGGWGETGEHEGGSWGGKKHWDQDEMFNSREVPVRRGRSGNRRTSADSGTYVIVVDMLQYMLE